MRYLCSVCSHQGDSPRLPSFCPSCGASSDDLWVLSNEAKAAFRGSSARGNQRPGGYFRWGFRLILLAALCLIPTPLGEEKVHRPFADETGSGQAWMGVPAVPVDPIKKPLWQPETVRHEEGEDSNKAVRPGGEYPTVGAQSVVDTSRRAGKQFAGSAEPAFSKGGGYVASLPIEPKGTNISKPSASGGADLDATPVLDPCPELAAPGRALIFVIDASVSMGLPADFPVSSETILDKHMNAGDEEARGIYRSFLSSPGPKRLDHARSTFADALGRLDPAVAVGVVSFRSCADVDSLGPYDGRRFGRLIDHVRSLEIQRGGETAITESMTNALSMLGPAGGHIVLITDGRETCTSDPCLVYGGVPAQNVVVDVVDMTGSAPVSCLADRTGGRIYRPASVPNLSDVLVFVRERLKVACMPRRPAHPSDGATNVQKTR